MADEAVPETELAPAPARDLIDAGAALVDVRRDYEYEGARLPGSRHLDLNQLSEAAGSLPRDRPVLFYCRTGNRSQMATQAFREAGYDAYNLSGGIEAWAAEGLPVEPEGAEIRQPLPPS